MDYDPTLDTAEVETRHNAELLEIELTKVGAGTIVDTITSG